MRDFQADHGFAPTQLLTHEFRASWRSPTGTVGVLMGLLTLGIVAFIVFGPSTRIVALLWVLLALFLLLTWACLRMLASQRPILRVGPEGISGFALKKGPIAWSSVTDISEQSFQNNRSLVITLDPASAPTSWWGGRRKKQAISLVPVHPKSVDDAVAAAYLAFSMYGGEQAGRAMQLHQAEAAAAVAFETRLDELTPTTWALYLMVAVNAAVWLANLYGGMNALKPSPAMLFAWGANSASAVVLDREYWRLLTNTFLHGGLMHLLLNMLGLWEAGRQLNRMYGHAQFLLIYLASALAGSALSLHYSAQQSVSVGASGAVFGVLGAILVAMYQHRGQIPKPTSKRILTSQGVFLAYALAQGFSRQGVDNAAHVGGLLCGCVLAWLLHEKIDSGATPARRRTMAIAGAGLSAAAVAVLVMTTPAPRVHHRQLFAFQTTLVQQAPAMAAAENALQADAQAARKGVLSEGAFKEAIRTRHLPAYEEIQRRLAPLDVPADDAAGQGMRDIKRGNALMVELMTLQMELADKPAGSQPAGEARAQAINDELRLIQTRLTSLTEKTKKQSDRQ